MNIEQANAIPLPEILHKIGCQPVKQKDADIWYNSPFRLEKTASFHVNTAKNVWYDFGEAKGGDVVKFVCAYLQSNGNDFTVSDALRWIKNMTFLLPDVSSLAAQPTDKATGLVLQTIGNVKDPALIAFLKSRGISIETAQSFLKEVVTLNRSTNKSFFALGFANEANGYELRNQYFKGCIGAKAISFVRAANPPATEIHIFEGFMDFLSAVEEKGKDRFEGDIIVLNSVACLPQIIPYIKNYTYRAVYSWLDNDVPGARAAQVLKKFVTDEAKISFRLMNNTYAPHKDVNAWRMNKLGL